MLEKISSTEDLKKLNYSQLEDLCADIRRYIIDTVSRNGGHLASNLGSVELTVALNRVYDASKDRILFDVGHQAYAHKILNGRKDAFRTIRTYGGISGFPKPYESPADAFIAGHSSDSISVALGMAKARTLLKENYDVCAVIGDGALTGGLAYEGIENVAGSREPMVIILNDNAMSISSNVGGMSKLLRALRLSEGYYDFKRRYRSVVGIDTALYRRTHKIKENIKERLFAGNMFTSMGLNYLGPVDGHDLCQLESAIRTARAMKAPVLLHVISMKGKGCAYAEVHPDKYHGVGPFDAETGAIKCTAEGFCDVMGKELCALAEKDGKITALTAAMSGGTGLTEFSSRFISRFFDVGIAEGHAVSMAAGMAKQGLIPVFAVYSTFLQRAYDMLIHDVALQNLHVVFCVDRAGLVGSDGETHQGSFDISYLSSVPGMTILCPSSFEELRRMLRRAIYEIDGPVAVRYPRGGEGAYKGAEDAGSAVLRNGSAVTVVAYGIMINEALSAADSLAAKGVEAEVIKLGRVLPQDFSRVLRSLEKTGRLLVAEDVCSAGCIGERILAAAAGSRVQLKASALINLGAGIVEHGAVDRLLESRGLDAASIEKTAMRLVKETEDGKDQA